MNENNEMSYEEAACKPHGNYGLCKTHPTCEMVQNMLKELRKENQRLQDKVEKLEDKLSNQNPNWRREE